MEFGVYLAEETGAQERVLLPKKQVPEGTAVGEQIEVFVYKDSKDRLISTVQEPKVQLGGLAVLKVSETGKIGAFLDWGTGKGSPASVSGADKTGTRGRGGSDRPLYGQEQPALRYDERLPLSGSAVAL